MALWLYKSEPDVYSYDQLVKDKKTWWTGVANAAARIHLRAAKKGDQVLFYHTGKEKAVVGVMEITQGPKNDPDDEDKKSVAVEVKPVRKLAKAVTLATIKGDETFEGWDLIRIGRLSVMPVPEAMWERIEELGK